MKKRHYSIPERIEGNEPLVKFANSVLEKTEMLRIVTAPSSTARFKDINPYSIENFYHCCMLETYFHSAIEHLRKWKEDAIKYNTEFQGSWKYYAIADRLDCIKEYGGEEDDYNEDGSVRTKWSNKELEGSSILYSWRAYNDIFLSSKVTDFARVSTLIQVESKLSIVDFFRTQGKELTTYKKDAQGNMIPQDWADEQMSKAKSEFVADNMVDFLTLFVKNCRTIIDQVEKLPYNKDHKDFFASLPNRIDAILDLKLSPL
jgi:hypothetical protein